MREDQRAKPRLTTMLTKSTTMTTLKTTLTMVRLMISMVWATAVVATKEEGEVSIISFKVFFALIFEIAQLGNMIEELQPNAAIC
jgi:hypothetical protein